MKLQLSTWPEVEHYLREHHAILIPIGSTEQHGPNGLIGTDAICPEVIADGVAAQRRIMIAPTLAIGMAQHHLGFPGSVTLRPSTLIAVIRDTVQSLALHGFRRFHFLNGHGGNIATVNAAFAEIQADYSLAQRPSPLQLNLHNWYIGRRVRALSRELFGSAEGSHATPSEVSLTWHAYPHLARTDALTPRPTGEGGFNDAADFRQRYPDGRIASDPSLASVEHGGRILQAAVEDVLEILDAS